MIELVIIICAVSLYFLSQGAPYVPTKSRDAVMALRLMNIPKGALIVDIGAGDGAVLKAAAIEGYKAVGIEIHPVLWLVAKMRTRRFGGNVQVVLGNAWHWHLPPETKGVFLFTAGPFTAKMQAWLRSEQARLDTPLQVVSLGFELPNETEVKRADGCILYRLPS